MYYLTVLGGLPQGAQRVFCAARLRRPHIGCGIMQAVEPTCQDNPDRACRGHSQNEAAEDDGVLEPEWLRTVWQSQEEFRSPCKAACAPGYEAVEEPAAPRLNGLRSRGRTGIFSRPLQSYIRVHVFSYRSRRLASRSTTTLLCCKVAPATYRL